MNQLTNQKLLNELNQRIKAGTIKINFDSEVLTDSGSSLFSNKNLLTLLIISSTAFALWSLYRPRTATTTVNTNLQIEDNEKP
jgi:hypothetical protein